MPEVLLLMVIVSEICLQTFIILIRWVTRICVVPLCICLGQILWFTYKHYHHTHQVIKSNYVSLYIYLTRLLRYTSWNWTRRTIPAFMNIITLHGSTSVIFKQHISLVFNYPTNKKITWKLDFNVDRNRNMTFWAGRGVMIWDQCHPSLLCLVLCLAMLVVLMYTSYILPDLCWKCPAEMPYVCKKEWQLLKYIHSTTTCGLIQFS